MSRRSAKLAVAVLVLCGAGTVASPALGTDADREREVTTPPQIATRGEMAAHICAGQSSYENEAGQQVELEQLPCTSQFAPLLAAAGDTLTVRTPRSARAVGLSVDGAEREEQSCRFFDLGRWLCTMPGDGDAALRLGIAYPFGSASWTFDSGLRPARRTARLRVAERAMPSPESFIEGSVQVVRLRRAGEKGPLLVRRLDGGAFTVRLPRGDYTLWSATRVCSGSCPTRDGQGSFGPPGDACRSRIRVAPKARLGVTVVTRVGEPCRVR